MEFALNYSRAEVDENAIQVYAGHETDHLPMTEPDWSFGDWALQQIRAGAWREPWVVSFEYGGVGGAWEALAERAVLEKDVPRLGEMVEGIVG